jgi:uncharacterized protein YciI
MRRIAWERPRRSTPATGENSGCVATSGGPFADRSGGLITFEADSGAEAERLVANDPFLRGDLIDRHG